MPGCYRCTPCGISWPRRHDLYGVCPKCEERTDYISDERPDHTPDEANSLRKHLIFERYYERREEKRRTAAVDQWIETDLPLMAAGEEAA